MRRVVIILISILIYYIPAFGQSFEFGIQYIPLQFSMISFDQDNIIFDDYTSLKITEPSFKLSVPSLSNSGLFVRYTSRHLSVQSGLNFYNNVYYYSNKSTYTNGTFVSFFYSSIDMPVYLAYTFRSDEILKFRILGGINSKMFKFRRNYYSVFTKNFDYVNYLEETPADKHKRDFLVEKLNSFIIYSRAGVGIQFYNFTVDLCIDKNLTDMNKKFDKYNANFKDSYLINLILSFHIAPKDLKQKPNKDKIKKE